MENVLYTNPWLDYFNDFYLSYNIIEYPKNVYFVANILSEHLKNNDTLYKEYQYAEKFDISLLNTIDWNTTIITFDKHAKIILAPEPIKKLINLSKRLDSEKAEDLIFGAFKVPVFNIKSFVIIIYIMIAVLFIKMCIYFDLFYRFKYL